jgi:electron transport complex protein RnfC
VQEPIGQAPLPSRLSCRCTRASAVRRIRWSQAGEQVLKGQLIGGADGWMSAAVHAPTSGTVLAIESMWLRTLRVCRRCAWSSSRMA